MGNRHISRHFGTGEEFERWIDFKNSIDAGTYIKLRVTVNNGEAMSIPLAFAYIDWGDGECNNSTSHIYKNAGDYTIFVCGVASTNSNKFNDKVTSVEIGGGVSIESLAFAQCTNLTSVTIGNGVTQIGAGAFDSCGKLADIYIPDTVTSIGAACFRLAGIRHIQLPRMERIENSLFSQCNNLTSVTIPDGVTSIGDGAFEYCINLKSVTLPESVTTISESAFYESAIATNGESKIFVPYASLERFKAMSALISYFEQIDAFVPASKCVGVSGAITIHSYEGWDGNEWRIGFNELGENDGIFFTPATAADKEAMENANIFISVNDDGVGDVVFAAETKPTDDITLKYFIVRGM